MSVTEVSVAEKYRKINAKRRRIKNRTQKELVRMLTENTGRALCDSGDYYGRHWQQNQGRAFKDEPAATLSVRWGIDVSLSVFHFLADRLDYSGSMNRRFKAFVRKYEREHGESYWLELADAWCEHLRETGKADRWDEWHGQCVNTYNGEDLLCQILQYTLFTYEGTGYVLLQIHGGCDARGGYTTPVVFECDPYAMFDNNRAEIGCENGHLWDNSYDGYHFKPAEIEQPEPGSWLPDYGQVEFDLSAEKIEVESEMLPLDDYECIDVDDLEENPGTPVAGKLCYRLETDEAGLVTGKETAFCPVCCAKLSAYAPCAG